MHEALQGSIKFYGTNGDIALRLEDRGRSGITFGGSTVEISHT